MKKMGVEPISEVYETSVLPVKPFLRSSLALFLTLSCFTVGKIEIG